MKILFKRHLGKGLHIGCTQWFYASHWSMLGVKSDAFLLYLPTLWMGFWSFFVVFFLCFVEGFVAVWCFVPLPPLGEIKFFQEVMEFLLQNSGFVSLYSVGRAAHSFTISLVARTWLSSGALLNTFSFSRILKLLLNDKHKNDLFTLDASVLSHNSNRNTPNVGLAFAGLGTSWCRQHYSCKCFCRRETYSKGPTKNF